MAQGSVGRTTEKKSPVTQPGIIPGTVQLVARHLNHYAALGPLQICLLLLLLVFSPWAGLGRDQSSVRRLVWLWYAASWASS